MAILLYRSYKIAEDASTRAAKVFMQNIAELDLIDEANKLRDEIEGENLDDDLSDGKVSKESIRSGIQISKQIDKKPNISNISQEMSGFAPPIPFFLKGANRIAKLFLPLDFTNDDLDYIQKVIEVNKRPE